jgi:hypothetical protein
MARQPRTRQCPWPVLTALAAAPPMKPTTAPAFGYHHRRRCQSPVATSGLRNQPASLWPPAPPLARREGAAGHGPAAVAGRAGPWLAASDHLSPAGACEPGHRRRGLAGPVGCRRRNRSFAGSGSGMAGSCRAAPDPPSLSRRRSPPSSNLLSFQSSP